MKKIFILSILSIVVVFQFCTSTRKAAANKPALVTYLTNVQPLISANCSPCHIPPQGNKKPLNSFAAAKDEIDEILVRIQKNPGEKGFMPFKHPKLSDSTINVFKQWNVDGLLEK